MKEHDYIWEQRKIKAKPREPTHRIPHGFFRIMETTVLSPAPKFTVRDIFICGQSAFLTHRRYLTPVSIKSTENEGFNQACRIESLLSCTLARRHSGSGRLGAELRGRMRNSPLS